MRSELEELLEEYFSPGSTKSKRRQHTGRCEPTLPALANVFPCNDLLIDGRFNIGKLGVRTRRSSFRWKHRGLTILYTSKGVHGCMARAYGLDSSAASHQVLVGLGDLVDVRFLTAEEIVQLSCHFNNIRMKKKIIRIYAEALIYLDPQRLNPEFLCPPLFDPSLFKPGEVNPECFELEPFGAGIDELIFPLEKGLFFKNLQRFKEPIPFVPNRGAINIHRVPISLVKKQLEEIDIVA